LSTKPDSENFMANDFFKGHGLGNDYIVLDPMGLTFDLTPERIRKICDRRKGIGSDGILTLENSCAADFGLRIWNSDGSEAEISGNGLRIFALYLHTTGRTKKRSFYVETPSRKIRIDAHINSDGTVIGATIQMGRATFRSGSLPCTLEIDELIKRPIKIGNETIYFTGVNIGNPHCVIFKIGNRLWSREELLRLGPQLETHPIFPERINVQLADVTSTHNIHIHIWERGVGETKASGSSACAAACAAVRLGLVTSPVTVQSTGGALQVNMDDKFNLTLSGPVDELDRGTLSPSLLSKLKVPEDPLQFA